MHFGYNDTNTDYSLGEKSLNATVPHHTVYHIAHEHSLVWLTKIIRRNHCLCCYSYTFLRSMVCLSVCRLSHLCPLLNLFSRFRCYLAGTHLWGPITYCVRWGSLTPTARGDSRVKPHSQNMQLQIAAATWQIQRSDTACCQISLVIVFDATV